MQYCVLEISIKSLSNVYVLSTFFVFLIVAEIVIYMFSVHNLYPVPADDIVVSPESYNMV